MTTSAPLASARTEEMVVIHRVFRHGFPMIAELVRLTPQGATGRANSIAPHLDFMLNGLHHHHTGEDEQIWPILLERANQQTELIGRMEKQHAVIAERSHTVRTLLGDWRESAAHAQPLADAIDEFTAALVAHLDDEETHVVPLIRTHITAEEWEHFGETTFEKFTNSEKAIATGTLEDVASPEEAAWFTEGLPLPIKVMWRLAGRRRYDRYIAGVRGESGIGPVQRKLFRTANRLLVALYRRSGGKIGGSAKGIPVLLITAPGRRTGIPHTVPVVYFEQDGTYIVTGSSGGSKDEPQWFRNVRSASEVRIEIDDEIQHAQVVVADTAVRDRLWNEVVLDRAPFFAKYQNKAGRIIPIAVLTPTQRSNSTSAHPTASARA